MRTSIESALPCILFHLYSCICMYHTHSDAVCIWMYGSHSDVYTVTLCIVMYCFYDVHVYRIIHSASRQLLQQVSRETDIIMYIQMQRKHQKEMQSAQQNDSHTFNVECTTWEYFPPCAHARMISGWAREGKHTSGDYGLPEFVQTNQRTAVV